MYRMNSAALESTCCFKKQQSSRGFARTQDKTCYKSHWGLLGRLSLQWAHNCQRQAIMLVPYPGANRPPAASYMFKRK